MTERIEDIDPRIIEDSPTNPRQHYPEPTIVELANSIAENGVLQPLVVRKRPGGNGWEAVVGHRRKRAAIKAGLKTVPCIIRDMSDNAVREVQHVENAQREDVHPMEEALSFEELVKIHDGVIDSVAAKVGKSTQYIQSRMRLLALTNQNRELYLNGRFELGHALTVALLKDEKDQDDAGKFAAYGWSSFSKTIAQCEKQELEDQKEGNVFEPTSLAQTRRRVEELMRDIGSAPWDPADATLLPEAGPCSTCPKMTGNRAQEQLFATDVQEKGRCTDRKCYSLKMDALWKRLTGEHKKIGGTVLTKKQSKDVFGGATNIQYDSDYDDLTRHEHQLGTTLQEAVEPDPKDIILARDGMGTIRFLYPKKKAASVLRKKRSKSGTGKLTPKEKSERKDRKRKNETDAAMRHVMEVATRIILGDPEFREKTEASKEASEEDRLIALAVMAIDADFEGRIAQSLDYANEQYVDQLDGDLVLMEMYEAMRSGKLDPLDVLMRSALRRYRGFIEVAPAFEIVCKHLLVDVQELVDKNMKELEEKWAEQDARAKKKSASKKNGKKGSTKKKTGKKKEATKKQSDGDDAPGPEAA